MSKASRQLIDLLGKPADHIPLRPDQMHYASIEGAESFYGCVHMAQLLFTVFREGLTAHAKRDVPGIEEARAEKWGDQAARRIFAMWCKPPSARRLQQIRNEGLLAEYDMMKPQPNVMRLAREQAELNKSLPPEQRRGAGGTDAQDLDKLIRRLLAARKRRRQKAQARQDKLRAERERIAAGHSSR